MATANSFKKMQEEEEQQFPHPPPEVERNVMGNARNIQFVGDVVELYLSRFFDMLVSIFGGTSPQQEPDGGESDIDLSAAPKGRSNNSNLNNP